MPGDMDARACLPGRERRQERSGSGGWRRPVSKAASNPSARWGRGAIGLIRNIYEAVLQSGTSHGGPGTTRGAKLFSGEEFASDLRFINYTELEKGVSIGYHTHGRDEEVYVILEGGGEMTLEGRRYRVKRGDVVVNRPGGSHGLVNDGEEVLKVLVFEVAAPGVNEEGR